VPFCLGVERQVVNRLQHVAKDVARPDLVAKLGEDFADLILNCLRPGGRLAEGGEVGEQLLINELDQVVTNAGGVVVELAVFLGRGPFVPAEFAVDDRGVVLAVKFGSVAALGFKVVQVLEKQNRGGLLDIVQLVGDTPFGPEVFLDLVECVFVHVEPQPFGVSSSVPETGDKGNRT
jgi:hypothetical protein